ncbi:MAG: putative 26S proteasome regulatory subunit [Sporothrix epigloea]
MEVIEKLLHEHFASLDADADETPDNTDGIAAVPVPRDSILEVIEPPFAKVNSVVDGSPAAEAGLRAGDQIRRFGYVNHANNERLVKVSECVVGNEGSVDIRSGGSGSCSVPYHHSRGGKE